jgi:hypothetical protein
MWQYKFARLVIALTGVVAVGSVVAIGSVARGQSFGPGVSHFTIVPKLSVLQRTGGLAGVDERLRLTGKFDLQILPPAIYPPMVALDNAEVWGSLISKQPHPLVVEDVDQLLNLEQLHGRQHPKTFPYTTYKFGGKLDDGSSIELTAAQIGDWIYFRGGTTPPPGGADYFKYQLRMVARTSPFADLNEDGIVDAADYTLLRDAGGTGGGASADSIAAGATYDLWKQQFGEAMPDFAAIDAAFDAAAGGTALVASAVPEPSAIVLLLLAVTAVTVRRRSATV